jgi:hypothetical protein
MTDSEDARQAAIARFAEHWARCTQQHHSWQSWKPPSATKANAEVNADQSHCHSHGVEPVYTTPIPAPHSTQQNSAPPVDTRNLDAGRLDAASQWALLAYPGAIGELISREISAHVGFGFRFDSSGLINRLANQVLDTPLPATSVPVSARTPGSSTPQVNLPKE